MSITGYFQLDDGLGECSALDQIKANGITTGRTSNLANAAIVRRVSLTGTNVPISTLADITPQLTATKCSIAWIYVNVFVTSTTPFPSAGEYIGLRVMLLGDQWDRYIYPAYGSQNGSFLHSISLKPITQNTGNGARILLATSSGSVRTVTWKINYLEYK